MATQKPCKRGHTSPRRSGNCMECQAASTARFRERRRALRAMEPEPREQRIRNLVAELYALVCMRG